MSIIEDTKKERERQEIINHIDEINNILRSYGYGTYTYDEVFRTLLNGQKLLMERLLDDTSKP